MKRIKLALILLGAAIASEAQTQDVSSLGSAITAQEGKSWIKNYTTDAGKEQSITFGKEVLNGLISKPGVEGVFVLRGLDKQDNEVLMLGASDKNGSIINNESIIGPDGFLTERTAQEMFGRFQSKFKNRTPGYLYGKNGFETILHQSNTEGIRFINGMDDVKVEHLILVGVDSKGAEQWTASIWNHGSGIFSFFGWGLLSKK